MRRHHRTLAGWFLTAVLVASCGGLGSPADADGDDPVPFVNPPATEGSGLPELEATCGSVLLTGGTAPVLPSEPLDDEAKEALASIGAAAPGEAAFVDDYEWFVAGRDGSSITLFGRALTSPAPGEPPYASATFSRGEEGFRPLGWGQCRIEVSAPGWGNAHWVLDAEPPADSPRLALLINESACASGQAPTDREVVPVVVSDVDRVTIIVLVEPVDGDATCPSNPWHPLTVTLPETPGERTLFDGSEVPALARPWPPTPSSLESLGYQD